jgi:hypothetical protein
MKYSNQEVFDEISRELAMRRRVYPRLIKRDVSHKDYLDPQEAHRRAEIMQQLADEYDPQSLFNKRFRFSEWLKGSGWVGNHQGDGLYIFSNGQATLAISSSDHGLVFALESPGRHPMTGIPLPETERQARLLIHTLTPSK